MHEGPVAPILLKNHWKLCSHQLQHRQYICTTLQRIPLFVVHESLHRTVATDACARHQNSLTHETKSKLATSGVHLDENNPWIRASHASNLSQDTACCVLKVPTAMQIHAHRHTSGLLLQRPARDRHGSFLSRIICSVSHIGYAWWHMCHPLST